MSSSSYAPNEWNEFLSVVKNYLSSFAAEHWPIEADGSGPEGRLSLNRLFKSFPVPADIVLLSTNGIEFGGSTERYATAFRYDFSRPNTIDIRTHGIVPLNDLGSHPELIEGILGFEPDIQDGLLTPASIFAGNFPYCIHVVPYDARTRVEEYGDNLAEWLSHHPSELLEAFSAKTDFKFKYGLSSDPLLTDEQLLQMDETCGCFVKMSDGKPLTISERHKSIAHIQLIPQVPDSLKNTFRQAKRLYIYGYLEYDFFTVSLHYAHLALDAALHVRWSATLPPSVTISYYDKKTKTTYQHILANPSHVKIREYCQRAKWRIGAVHVDGKLFPNTVRNVVRELAEKNFLTIWQRKTIEEFDIKIRNSLTHLESAPIHFPSGHELELAADTINSLFDSMPLPVKICAP